MNAFAQLEIIFFWCQPHWAGDKGTILLDQPAEPLMTYTQSVTHDFPFMFYTHILEHEDGGTMGQYGAT
jgi:FtsP/CotA-like multicopper oxidase with cupredoxin domain